MTTPRVPSITDEQLAEIELASWGSENYTIQIDANDVRAIITRLRAADADAARYRLLRDGLSWPAVFASHDAPEPLRGADLDTAMERTP